MMSPLADVADIVAKATIGAGIAIAAGWLARRQRAAVRHLISRRRSSCSRSFRRQE